MKNNPILVALLHPLNLAMFALAVAAGLCSAWWLFPAGLLLWGVMVIMVARQPELSLRHKIESRSALAPRFQPRFDRIERIQVSLFNALASADPRVRQALKPVMDELSSLVEETYALCQRTSALENYRYVTEGKVDLEAEWVRLSQEIEKTTDARVRREYEEARTALEERLQRRNQVVTQLDRVEAQLTGMANSLDAFLSEVLSLQALGVAQIKQNLPRLRQLLRQQIQELRSFDNAEPLPPAI